MFFILECLVSFLLLEREKVLVQVQLIKGRMTCSLLGVAVVSSAAFVLSMFSLLTVVCCARLKLSEKTVLRLLFRPNQYSTCVTLRKWVLSWNPFICALIPSFRRELYTSTGDALCLPHWKQLNVENRAYVPQSICARV